MWQELKCIAKMEVLKRQKFSEVVFVAEGSGVLKGIQAAYLCSSLGGLNRASGRQFAGLAASVLGNSKI